MTEPQFVGQRDVTIGLPPLATERRSPRSGVLVQLEAEHALARRAGFRHLRVMTSTRLDTIVGDAALLLAFAASLGWIIPAATHAFRCTYGG